LQLPEQVRQELDNHHNVLTKFEHCAVKTYL